MKKNQFYFVLLSAMCSIQLSNAQLSHAKAIESTLNVQINDSARTMTSELLSSSQLEIDAKHALKLDVKNPVKNSTEDIKPQPLKKVVENYIQKAHQLKLVQHATWQRLMYADKKSNSQVSFDGYFISEHGKTNLSEELAANIDALFANAEDNQSVRCKFPARSQWLIEQLDIATADLAAVNCPELDQWIAQIKPHKATLIYATDFMGNPSSMFGHTLLRLDPKDQKELNLISYAVNYAATVTSGDDLAFAWKGLTGQYAGEYSLMPYYRKVKEYGDFESRDLWEYELALDEKETTFLVHHIWEMKHVSFPYYFINDNCAYRLLGLIDLIRPEANLVAQFGFSAIPIETIKALKQQDLIRDAVYRPALETQLLAQAKQHGDKLAKVAHAVGFAEPAKMATMLNQYPLKDQAKILEMAYDDLYLQFIAQKVDEKFAQPRLRTILQLRSQSEVSKQRATPQQPKADPSASHQARNLSISMGEVQGQQYMEIGHRQAYHDLIDPQAGLRTGTQLLFMDASIQLRGDQLKFNHLDLLKVNSYNPISPFKIPLSWGFNLGWQQESLNQHGQFSEDQQHGVAHVKTQFGYSQSDQEREHLCYAQIQNQFQAGKALEHGWRVGIGPTLGCQNIWTGRIQSLLQVELPYWEDSKQWNLRVNSNLQYMFNAQNVLRAGWEYQTQDGKNWDKWKIGYIKFF